MIMNIKTLGAIVGLISLRLYEATVVLGEMTVASELFERVGFSTVMKYTAKELSPSLSRCAGLCLRSSGCRSLCHSVSASACYLYEGPSSPEQPFEGDTSDLSCFTSRYCSSVQGYSKYGGLCVKQYTDALPYLNATSRCEADGAHLVHCKSEAHKTALESFFYSEGVTGGMWWVGADDLDTEGNFVWRSDGTQLLSTDSLWNTGEPNGGAIENCVQIYPHLLKLNDYVCARACTFVCQVDPW